VDYSKYDNSTQSPILEKLTCTVKICKFTIVDKGKNITYMEQYKAKLDKMFLIE